MLMFEGLVGTMLKRFVIAKSFRLHISKPKKIPGNIFVEIPKVRNSSRRGLFGRCDCILEPEKHPAGAFWADKIVF